MKTKLIIINWLVSFALLSYNGEDPIIALALVAYFGTACKMLTNEGRKVKVLIYLFEKRMFNTVKVS